MSDVDSDTVDFVSVESCFEGVGILGKTWFQYSIRECLWSFWLSVSDKEALNISFALWNWTYCDFARSFGYE
jgi:hypothetical protein